MLLVNVKRTSGLDALVELESICIGDTDNAHDPICKRLQYETRLSFLARKNERPCQCSC